MPALKHRKCQTRPVISPHQPEQQTFGVVVGLVTGQDEGIRGKIPGHTCKVSVPVLRQPSFCAASSRGMDVFRDLIKSNTVEPDPQFPAMSANQCLRIIGKRLALLVVEMGCQHWTG
jgi:hypothetical protein